MEKKLYNRCLKCGRVLKNLEYRQRGYGKICWEKVHSDIVSNRLFEVQRREGENGPV